MRLTFLVLKNLQRHKRSFSFSIIGIILGVTSFVVFLSLGQGLRVNVLERIFTVNQLEVTPRRIQMGAFQQSGALFGNGTGLDDFTVEDMSRIPGVTGVYPKMQLSFPGLIWGGQEIFGRNFWTELIADGISAELITAELPPIEDPNDAFIDWDGETFTCDMPGGEGRGWTVGCPPGRYCDEAGECVRAQCNPDDEVLTTDSRPLAVHAKRFLRRRLNLRRSPPEIRSVVEDDSSSSESSSYRLTVGDSHIEDARRVLPDFIVPRVAQQALHMALDETILAVSPDSRRQVGDDPIEMTILFEGDLSCGDPPSYCPADTRVCEMPIPVISSPFLLELYNTSVQTVLTGSTRSMPSISPDALLGFTAHVDFGRGMLGEAVLLDDVGVANRLIRLVGWSPRAIRMGATMPLGYVQRLNAAYKGEEAVYEYHSILLLTERNEALARIALIVQEDLGFSIGPEYEQAERGSLMITLLTVGLLMISALIILLAALNITHTFLMVITERRREIGLLRAVGARRWDISRIILMEAAVIGTAGAALACAISLGVARLADYAMNRYVPDFPFKPETLFAFDLRIFAAGFGVALLFSLLGAFLPAYRAARMDPAEALRAQ